MTVRWCSVKRNRLKLNSWVEKIRKSDVHLSLLAILVVLVLLFTLRHLIDQLAVLVLLDVIRLITVILIIIARLVGIIVPMLLFECNYHVDIRVVDHKLRVATLGVDFVGAGATIGELVEGQSDVLPLEFRLEIKFAIIASKANLVIRVLASLATADGLVLALHAELLGGYKGVLEVDGIILILIEEI